jgi:hypothetical protein
MKLFYDRNVKEDIFNWCIGFKLGRQIYRKKLSFQRYAAIRRL